MYFILVGQEVIINAVVLIIILVKSKIKSLRKKEKMGALRDGTQNVLKNVLYHRATTSCYEMFQYYEAI